LENKMKIKDILGEDDVPMKIKSVSGDEVDIDQGGTDIKAKVTDLVANPDKPGEFQMKPPPTSGAGALQPGATVTTNTQEEVDDEDLTANGNHDVGGDATDSYINQVRDKDFERAQGQGPEMEEDFKDLLGMNKSPEEWAKTSTQMATLLQFQKKYQGTPYADQIEKRIQLLKDRLDIAGTEVAGPGGTPKPVVPPEQFNMNQLKESDDALLEKMRMIAGLR
jgi:hypothetical protein